MRYPEALQDYIVYIAQAPSGGLRDKPLKYILRAIFQNLFSHINLQGPQMHIIRYTTLPVSLLHNTVSVPYHLNEIGYLNPVRMSLVDSNGTLMDPVKRIPSISILLKLRMLVMLAESVFSWELIGGRK